MISKLDHFIDGRGAISIGVAGLLQSLIEWTTPILQYGILVLTFAIMLIKFYRLCFKTN